jgi:hypothetical protein
MSFFPVVDRELRVLSRSRRLYWGRLLAGLIAEAAVAWCWFMFARGSSSDAAAQIFTALAILAFAYSLLAGPFLTADCISEEKREGTLGLLFLTDLKGYHVALGKLAANSLQAVYDLLAIFPILTIPLLLGGLAGAEVFRTALVLLDCLIFSLTVGLLVSAWSRQDRQAQAGALSFIIAITGGIPALLSFLSHQYHLRTPNFLYALSPGYTLVHAFDQKFKTEPAMFWMSLGIVHALSWLAFILAALIVRRTWQDRPEGAVRAGWREAFRRWKHGSTATRAAYRQALLKSNPYFWLGARDRLKPYYVLWFLAGCALFWFVLWVYNGRDMLDEAAFFATALLLRTVLKIWIASEAGRQIFDDRRSSALELTLSTPLPVREILEGQFLALLRQFGPAIGIVLAFDLLGIAISGRIGSDNELLLSWIASIIVFILDTATLSAFGIWLALRSRRFSRAIAKNLFFVLVLPWIVFFALLTYMSIARLPRMETLNAIIGMYFVISLLTDLILFLNASGNLTSRFREIATSRFDPAR